MLNIISQAECWITSPNYSLLQLCLHLWCFYLPCQLVPFLAVLLFFPFKQTYPFLYGNLWNVCSSQGLDKPYQYACVCVCALVYVIQVFSLTEQYSCIGKLVKARVEQQHNASKGRLRFFFFCNFSWMNHKVAIIWHIFLLKNWPCCASRQQNSMKEPYRHSLVPNNHVYLIYTNMPGLTI